MPSHIVRQGECLTSIARRYGFADPKRIYDDPNNAALREKRPNPNVLFPGDEVFIPERDIAPITIQTGKPAKLVATVPRRELRLTLFGPDRMPLTNEPFTVEAGDEVVGGTTDGEGVLVASVSATARNAIVTAADLCWEVRVGELDPMSDAPDGGEAGARARLANLGFSAGDKGSPGSRQELTEALRAFQRQHGLEETGSADGPTTAKLQEIHGS